MKIFADILDTYEQPVEIGKGGGGTVYKSYHKRLRKDVVLKKINTQKVNRDAVRKEVDILKELSNRFIPQVYDFVETDSAIFTVMSFIPGRSFSQEMDAGRIFTREQIKKWAVQLLSALDYIHTRKPAVIHGDIKPSNIMLKPDGDICLIDFNISLHANETHINGFSPGFASPEQYNAAKMRANNRRKNQTIDERSDIYSLGAFLYFISTGKIRYDYSESINYGALKQIMGSTFANAIVKAMSLNPADRFATAGEMSAAIRSEGNSLKNRKTGVIVIASIVAVMLIGGTATVRAVQHHKYDNMVENQKYYIDNCDFVSAQSEFDEATDLLPRELDAYYQNARRMYVEGDDEKCLDYIEQQLLGGSSVRIKGESVGPLYKLAGICAANTGESETAVSYYERALDECEFEGDDYRDYAVALSHNGQHDKAYKMLDKALEKGAEPGTAEYIKGEIAYSDKDYEIALDWLNSAVHATNDNDLKTHAYWTVSKIKMDCGNAEGSRDALISAKNAADNKNKVAVLHELVQTDVNLADNTGNEAYREEAAGFLNELVGRNWASKGDYHSLAIIYIKLGETDAAAEIIEKQGNVFGKDYDYYKLKAINEAHIQSVISQEYRDYSNFKLFYDKSKSGYNTSGDVEMNSLDNIYNQLKQGGWL